MAERNALRPRRCTICNRTLTLTAKQLSIHAFGCALTRRDVETEPLENLEAAADILDSLEREAKQ